MTDDTQAKVAETVARLRALSEQRMSATPKDDPDHYLNVIARLSREDGAEFAASADLLEALAAENAATNGVWQANLALIADRDRLAEELAAARDPAALAGDETVQAMIGAAFKLAAAPRMYEDYRNAAIHYRHDFGLLPRLDQSALCREAEHWHHALAHQTEELTPADATAALARALQAERQAGWAEGREWAAKIADRYSPDIASNIRMDYLNATEEAQP